MPNNNNFGYFDALPIGIFVLDASYSIRFWNRFLENSTGWKFADLAGKDARELLPGLTRPDYELRINDVFRSGVPAVFSPQLHRPLIESAQGRSGKRKVHSTSVTALTVAGEKGFLAVVAIQDVTDLTHRLEQIRVTATRLEEELSHSRKLEAELEQAAEELKRSNSELIVANHTAQTLIESVPSGILVVNRAGEITMANPAAGRLFGYATEELVGQPVEILIPARIREGHPEYEKDFLWNPQTRAMDSEQDLHGLRKDGSEFPMEIGLARIQTDAGTSGLCSIVDMTARKLAEQKILQMAQMKSEFVANVSHEIRTPLNVLIGMSGLMRDTMLTTEQADYNDTIHRAAEALLEVINGVLDFSKLEAGKLETDLEDFNLDSMAEDIIEFFTQQALRKGLELTYFVDPTVPSWARGDRRRLRQILTNLIGNAIKFTENGEVSLNIRSVTDPGGRRMLRFEVIDTGIGISREVQGRLFQAFTQADGSTTRQYGGSGLGLAISRRLTELMGGSIGVASEREKGSTFWVELPFHEPSEPNLLASEPEPEFAGTRVLVVDNLESNRAIAGEYLRSWGMKADSAANGIEGVRMIRNASQSGRPYDLVLLDCGMPEMSGLDVARIVNLDGKISSTRLIVMVSHDDRAEANSAKDLGILAFLNKPIRKQQLRKAISRVFLPKQAAQEETFGEPASKVMGRFKKSANGIRLLLVEDNEDNQKLAARLLEKHGYACDIASNGLAAVEKLAVKRYPVVLMDCQMPTMDGFQATAAVRRHEIDRHTPIIAMTAHALLEDREKCLAAGMDDYLAKPISEKELIATIERWLPTNEKAAEQEPEPSKASAAFASKIQVPAKAGLETLIPTYLSNRQKDILCLTESLKKGDLEAARFVGHGMKGSGAGYGFRAISEIGGKIEQSAAARDAAGIEAQIASLEDYLSRLEVVY